MQLMKAMKKMKFWSKKSKKKKKKNNFYHNANLYYQPPYYPLPHQLPPPPPPDPPGGACECHFCQVVEPSAPPLPPWLEVEGTSGSNWIDPFLGQIQLREDHQCISISQEIVVKRNSQLQHYSGSSMPMREKSASRGLFGCGVGVGSFLVRCFFPCFHISEAPIKR